MAGTLVMHADAGAESISSKSACSLMLSAGAGADADASEGLCAVRTLIRFRKNAGFSQFSSMSFCKPASIAEDVREMQDACGDCCCIAQMARVRPGNIN